ncbi:hypothetical protein HK096_002657, partial [Nowakowskiella sp. JEL0078]
SLERLGTDYVDLLQIHRWDYNTPIEETMSALNDLVRSGKVRYIGASSMYAWQFAKANHIAEKNGWAKFVSMQNYYNAIYREEEREMLPYCLDARVGVIPWGPLAQGMLTGRKFGDTKRSESAQAKYDLLTESDKIIIERVQKVAEDVSKRLQAEVTVSQVALAWMISKSSVTAPIVGISKLKYLDDALASLNHMFKRKQTASTQNVGNPSGEVKVHSRNVKYPYRLNFYHSPPDGEITLDDFELMALDRLRVLKATEEALIRRKTEVEVYKHILQATKKYLPIDKEVVVGENIDSPARRRLLQEQRRKDHISHFILRQAFCKTEELRSWFLRQEIALFKARFEDESKSYQQIYINHLNLDIEVMTNEEKHQHGTWIMHLHEIKNIEDLQKTTFYRAKFENVLDLVARRSVVFKNGYAYVAENQRSILVVNTFKDRLKRGLEAFDKVILDDDRLTNILENLAKQHLTRESYNVPTGDSFSAADVDNMVQHFPACMRNLGDHLKEAGHLKHFGRMQFGLYLKGMGLPVEESLLYWRKAFRHITEDEFSKRYAYNIRHNYGLEGKRTNYTPYSCMKVISSNPGSGEHHGCPYKHFSSESLRAMVSLMGVPESNASEVLKIARDGHYQLACTRVFELTRSKIAPGVKGGGENDQKNENVGNDLVETIQHPNHYFVMSYKGTSFVPSNPTPNRNIQSNVSGMVDLERNHEDDMNLDDATIEELQSIGDLDF